MSRRKSHILTLAPLTLATPLYRNVVLAGGRPSCFYFLVFEVYKEKVLCKTRQFWQTCSFVVEWQPSLSGDKEYVDAMLRGEKGLRTSTGVVAEARTPAMARSWVCR
ncbi:hypothetical protein AVEN_64643-1 [Araneus ventricosus]|uniref:Secreted protein n=1 Tax=Araneus ventricosus TaxID=182803 RepID=A0A4Y2I0J4_ARAVE|nr:hypothetical protein AVEN_64643-1 [Araneus ventricosus]